MLRESKDDAGSEAKVVLNIGGTVWKLGAKPVYLNGPHGKVPRQADVDTAADLQGEGIIVSKRSGQCRKVAVEAVRLADQSLAEDGEILFFAGVTGSVPGVTRAEGGSDHR